MQLAASTLVRLGDTTRKIYLYDTYEGMPEPGEADLNRDGHSARQAWKEGQEKGQPWGFGGTLEGVKTVMESTGYPQENLVYVKGMVEDTVPGVIPGQIALLRLDTDFYSSTYHELEHLYPRLTKGGFLIVDDHGYYRGSRKATDEYLSETGDGLFLSRTHWSVRPGVKP